MKKHYLLILTALFCSSFVKAQDNPLRCGNELLENAESQNAKVLEQKNKIEKWLAENPQKANNREKYTIPVVVHVLYNNEEEKLSRQQVLSQIAVLNEDFNAQNADTVLIPGEFQDDKANVGFTFCLAAKTPDGDDSDGIVYQATDVDCIANTFDEKNFNNRAKLYYTDDGGSNAWDPSRYLNIWVGNACGKYLGQTANFNPSYPGEDGVVVDYQYFGSGCTKYPFHLGRTTTHEVGHYFGLNHVFSGSCEGDDGISDTPQQENSYSGCPSYPQLSCGTRDMFMNFMDYVNDDCMKLFTKEQKDWMVATLEMDRSGLLGFQGCHIEETPSEAELHIFPNPTQHCFYINLDKSITSPVNVRLFDSAGQLFYEHKSSGNFIRPIPVESLAVGIYFLRLDYEGGTETHKVMVAR